jgi:hypothetical protein
VGPVNPCCGDLSIKVSTVTHTLEGIGQYAILDVRLCMMEGDAEGMADDEAILKTSLNLTTSSAASWAGPGRPGTGPSCFGLKYFGPC